MTAKETFWQYLREGLEMTPPFKGYGMQLVRFSSEHPDMFRELFVYNQSNWDGYSTFLKEYALYDEVVPCIMKSFGLNLSEAGSLFEKVFASCIGISFVMSTHSDAFSEEELADMLGQVCRANLLALKSGGDTRTNFMPKIGGIIPGKLSEYIKVPSKERFTILGVNAEKSTVKIFLDEILYFEAVGELVFAYTKDDVYEIKMRLYQIEAKVANNGFIRVSKSIIINMNEVKTLHPGTNRCMYALLSNDEQIVVSRNYAKTVKGRFL